MSSIAPSAARLLRLIKCDFVSEEGVECPKTFRDREKMERHKFQSRAHGLAEKKFACNLCTKSYLSSDSLRKHKRQAHPGASTTNVETEPPELMEMVSDQNVEIEGISVIQWDEIPPTTEQGTLQNESLGVMDPIADAQVSYSIFIINLK